MTIPATNPKSKGGKTMVERVTRVSAVAAIFCAAASTCAPAAEAEDYPAKPVRLIIASAPGGGIDIVGRLVAQKLGEAWPQQMIPDNRPGGGNTVGTSIVAKAPADGYTLLVQSLGIAYAGELRKLPFDATRDLTPVVPVATQPNMLGVHVSVPAKTARDFIQLAKA